MVEEEWRDVPNTNGSLRVSNLGRVQRVRRKTWQSGSIIKKRDKSEQDEV